MAAAAPRATNVARTKDAPKNAEAKAAAPKPVAHKAAEAKAAAPKPVAHKAAEAKAAPKPMVRDVDGEGRGSLRALLTESEKSPADWFQAIARTLFTEWRLQTSARSYELAEIEFYLYNDDHPDPYVHCHDRQLSYGEWYFHRDNSAKIGFTLKGVDLTFAGAKSYGGILIRALHHWQGDYGPDLGLIEGPSKVVDRILKDCDVESVMQLYEMKEYADNAFVCGPLKLVHGFVTNPVTMAAGPRIGLRDKPKDPTAAEYRGAPYRFHAYPKLAKKEKKNLKLL